MTEHCQNPWKETCHSEDIKLYIQIKNKNLPICRDCWNKIAVSNDEWGPETQTKM